MLNRTKGFTLIELLVVVAVIGVLASIAAVNFSNALIKCRVAVAKSDLKALSQAIEMYRMDNQTVLPAEGAFDPSYFERLRPLTSPIAYMSQLPTDPFQPMTSFFMFEEDAAHLWVNKMYVYNRGDVENGGITAGKDGKFEYPYSIASTGPDHHLKYPYYFFPKGFVKPERYIYNPTNGMNSEGEIFVRSSNL
jgi:type II secretion system protein G